MKSYRSARDVLASVERAIADDHPVQHTDTLQEITRILHDDRYYFWVGIYLVIGKQAVRAAFSGPEAAQPRGAPPPRATSPRDRAPPRRAGGR